MRYRVTLGPVELAPGEAYCALCGRPLGETATDASGRLYCGPACALADPAAESGPSGEPCARCGRGQMDLSLWEDEFLFSDGEGVCCGCLWEGALDRRVIAAGPAWRPPWAAPAAW